MRILPEEKRNAMFAVYAFCREVDDIADGPGDAAEKKAALTGWRKQVDDLFAGRAASPVMRALQGPVTRFGLRQEDFLAVIEGMEMDASDDLHISSMVDLEYYCDRVACAVGRLSNRIFEVEEEAGNALARSLGQALQITNILRDLREDAALGRVYMPGDLLTRHGVTEREPAKILAHPSLPAACAELAEVGRRRFGEAQAHLSRCGRARARPAAIMMEIYRRLFERMGRRGWDQSAAPVRLSKLEKLWIALRHGLLQGRS